MDTLNPNAQDFPKKELPPLILKPDTYRIIVPAKVEEKIRYLLRKYPTTEWSGVLFTSHTGSFENNDLVITCEDIYPMDLGNSVYTDFQMNEDVAGYMAENMELFNCDLQLIHSHHSMSAFFSGTDARTLQEEGNERNCFVSLIVNNEGSYCAAITRKVHTEAEVIVKPIKSSYKFFGGGFIDFLKKIPKETKIINKEYIEYFMLKVEREEVPNPLGYLDDRFKEIIDKKNANTQKFAPNPSHEETSPFDLPFAPEDKDTEQVDFNKGAEEYEEKIPEDNISITPNEDLVDNAIACMLSLSLYCPTGAFNIDFFIHSRMSVMYNKIFEDNESEAYTGVNPFESWADFIVEFVINNFNDVSIPEDLLYADADAYYRIIAVGIYKKLQKYAECNDYIKGYLRALNRFI